MKIVLALVLIAAAVFRVTESAVKCATQAAQPTYAAGKEGECDNQCFASLSIAITGGAKLFAKGCGECTPGDTVIELNAAKDKWVKTECCSAADEVCNSGIDLSSSEDIGPKCMECDSNDEKCVKGGTTAADPYLEGTVVCNVETSSCSVEMKVNGEVKRGCEEGCVNTGKAGEATSKKCCKNADFCNNHDPTKESTNGGDTNGGDTNGGDTDGGDTDGGDTDGGDGDKDGAQAVFASYALLFSCLLLAYLK